MHIQEDKIKILRERLLEWGNDNVRDFPWRRNISSYRVLISETMLHRTRSSQVIDNYIRFITKYPDFRSICKAGLKKVMEDMKSLGLYWRSKMLYNLSCLLCERYDCELPLNKSILAQLPGIGEYISSAILCFVCDHSEPILDTNTVRIISRFFGIKMNDSSRRSRKYQNIMSEIIRGMSCREISYVMLDFGSIICKKRDPQCAVCPLRDMCEYHNGKR